MKSGLSLVLLAMLAVTSVYSLPKIDTDLKSYGQQLVAKVKEQMPGQTKLGDSSEEAEEFINKLQSLFGDLNFDVDDINAEAAGETGEIGPNFNSKQFLGMVKRVSEASWHKRCAKISGDASAYDKAVEVAKETKTCLENWSGIEDLMMSYNQTKMTGDYKLMLKSVCNSRSGFFACTDKYIGAISGCYFPSEMDFVHKVDRINKNMLDLVCSNDEDNFAIFDPEGDGLKCVQQSMTEMKTCANKAVYSVTERLLEKFIESEHFKFEMEPEDCSAFDEVKSCFVSSVENCTNPKVKNLVSSFFQIIRDESKC